MKLTNLLPSLLLAASASAQYFSAGWSPGQPAPDSPAAASEFNFDPSKSAPGSPAAAGEGGGVDKAKLGFMDKILTSPAVAGLFGKLGVNITDAVVRGSQSPWDDRIPLITDENYEDVVVNEQFKSEEEARDRVWIFVISVTASQNNAISKVVDQSFDEAYNTTLIAGDLPNVRWGRIDYMSVTYLTTKWSIWTGPWIVIATNRGHDLRFYKAAGIRLTPELIRELLTEEIWRNSEPWRSNFSPGGKREFMLHYFAYALMRIYNVVNRLPRFVLMIVTGAVASVVMRFLHSSSPKPAGAPQPAAANGTAPSAKSETETETAVSTTSAASSSTVTSGSSKKAKNRKAGKK
ncbi:hypothetical protein C8Q74DRAFT_1438652 [Fomes fomentarius]|nr:hypothetical protein C8Q74DRAFT_1438652 [Fomes fomentarius]